MGLVPTFYFGIPKMSEGIAERVSRIAANVAGEVGVEYVNTEIAGTKRMFLHSFETAFDYEFRGARHHFSAKAPEPPEFEKHL